jgi:uncharacterized protein (TIGR02448 family)
MKIIGALILALAALAATPSFADLQCGENGDMSPWCAVLLISTSPITTVVNLVGTTSAPTVNENSQAYVALVREDAAAYVATDGTEAAGAFLQDAMKSIRGNSSQAKAMSDLEIAKLVVTTLN